MSLIEIKDLSFSYNEKNKAVDGVSLNIEKGSYTTIIGHNGSGKSTLAKSLFHSRTKECYNRSGVLNVHFCF